MAFFFYILCSSDRARLSATLKNGYQINMLSGIKTNGINMYWKPPCKKVVTSDGVVHGMLINGL